ncbi:MAG: hypothetical protein P4L71_08600 [Acetobacteraceae bacterium]|nr:hypothetical protein [Acetobacteraceae bacterium]
MFHKSINLPDPRTGYGIIRSQDDRNGTFGYSAEPRVGAMPPEGQAAGADRTAPHAIALGDRAQGDTNWPDVDPGYTPAIGRTPLVPSFSTAELREIVMQILG